MNYYNEIKQELINNEIYKRVKDYSKNKSDLNTYYNVGKLIIEAQGGEKRAKYGDNLIKEYSKKLMIEIDKKYSYRNLMSMRKFYLLFNNEKMNALRSQLTWTHYRELLKLNNTDEIRYYIQLSINQNLTYRELHERIKNKEYERLSEETKNKLISQEKIEINGFIKDPIIIKNHNNYRIISEKLLQRLIVEDISNFMKELGSGFSFIDSEYKIKIGDKYNYLDLLLYNIKFKCYVVVELKITEIKKEHIGQIQTYMNYIDKKIKTINENTTTGIIIVKKNDRYIMEYCSDKRILTREYNLI